MDTLRLGELVRAEARFHLASVWQPLRLALLLGFGLGLLLGVISLFGDPGPSGAPPWVMLLFCPLYGAWIGLNVGLPVGIGRLIWRAAGAWAFLPLLILPLGLVAAFWLGSPLLGWLTERFIDALLAGAQEHEALLLPYLEGAGFSAQGVQGPGWEAALAALAVLAALFSLEFVWLVLSTPEAWLWLLGLLVASGLTVAVGVLPPALLSLGMLARGVARRLRARHAGEA